MPGARQLSLLILALWLAQQGSRAALLTNIYGGGKKLSEITDFANRYLIVPSPALHHQLQQASPASTRRPPSPQSPTTRSSQPITGFARANASASPQPAQNPVEPALLLYSQTIDNPPISASNGPQTSATESGTTSTTTDFPNPNDNNLGSEITKILKKFFDHGYDKRVRPNYSGPPALVNVSFHIIGISSVDEVQMDFTTDFYFRQKWFDPRLEFNPVGNVDELCVGSEFAEKIWLPDTFFANEKTATFHKATTENTFIRIGNSGRVYRSIRLTVTCSCPMDLQYFPMDRQRCKIEIESYGYNTRDIDYRWEKGDSSVTLNTKIELPQFKILGFMMGQEVQNLSSGDYIRLYCEIHFVRSMGYYLIQIYIPASLIVIISWVSFWLHRNATPARVALGVTTVLTMTTLMSSTNSALPKISYIKSIDVFLGTCFVMVFASLLEYASVGYIGKRIAMKRKRLQELQQMQQHHQKVCVAAAASAAAAAAAAASTNQEKSRPQNSYISQQNQSVAHQDSLVVTPLQVNLVAPQLTTQTLQRRPGAPEGLVASTSLLGSKTLQRTRNNNNNNNNSNHRNNDPPHGQRSAIKVMLDSNQQHASHYHDLPGADQRRTSAAAAAAAAAAVANANAQPTSESEVNQGKDAIKICGLTPSAIDKHSRVVFPICFVCFNLMYWIIYGHISQQVEDKGTLIPFIKN